MALFPLQIDRHQNVEVSQFSYSVGPYEPVQSIRYTQFKKPPLILFPYYSWFPKTFSGFNLNHTFWPTTYEVRKISSSVQFGQYNSLS